jgi:hypothetical protein
VSEDGHVVKGDAEAEEKEEAEERDELESFVFFWDKVCAGALRLVGSLLILTAVVQIGTCLSWW